MNLFELNTQLAVKLGQSFDTLYNMDYNEYSLILNIVNKAIDEANNPVLSDINNIPNDSQVKVNLPDGIRLK
jgi:hypothetical protein